MSESVLLKTPHLQTALTGPLQLLEKNILSHQKKIEDWFLAQWQQHPAPLYGSVDLRNAGYKLAPVDMNLFPAGFNNLNQEFLPLSVEAAKKTILKNTPHAKKILIIPENHTRNVHYWNNVYALNTILTLAGFDVRIGSLLPDLTAPRDIALTQPQTTLQIEPIHRDRDQLHVDHFIPDVVLLNNDLSEGIPDILKDLQQPLIPPATLGWHQRLKSQHFSHYETIAQEFAQLIDIDPWLIAPYFRYCSEVNFMDGTGMDCLTSHVESLFQQIQKKYTEYHITCKPYIVVKADAGTYGMAVMIVHNVEDLLSLNRKERTRMAKTKSGQPVSHVIIQEGVYTFETWGTENAVAEPVVYLWGEHVVGGFYRVHKERGPAENLNSPGMHFEPLAFVKTCHQPCESMIADECQNRFYAYGVIARLSMLAAAKEMKEQHHGN